MFFLILGIYTILIIIIWGFFIVAKIHAYKFKNFSPHIKKVSFSLQFSLIILTILGYLIIFSIKEKIEKELFDNTNSNSSSIIETIKEKVNNNYNNDNIVDYDNF